MRLCGWMIGLGALVVLAGCSSVQADGMNAAGSAGDGAAGSASDGSVGKADNADKDAGDSATCPVGPFRAMWIWDPDVVTDAALRADLLAFSQQQGINRLYVQASTASEVLVHNLMKKDPQALASFLDETAQQCIGVELLFGHGTWALEDEHGIPIGLAQQVASFSSGLQGARPVGVHFDIEPHAIHGVTSGGVVWDWSTDEQRAPMVQQYLAMIEATASALSGSGLMLSVDIPFWWDSSDFNPVTFGGKTAPAAEHVIGLVDVATLMDYRDSAFGVGDSPATSANGAYDLAQPEIAYASATGGKVAAGLETGGCEKVGDQVLLTGELEDVVTFCDEGRAALLATMQTLEGEWKAQAGFAGLAVHHYGSWKDPSGMAP